MTKTREGSLETPFTSIYTKVDLRLEKIKIDKMKWTSIESAINNL